MSLPLLFQFKERTSCPPPPIDAIREPEESHEANIGEQHHILDPSSPTPNPLYLPLTDTLRLYAAWFLAWYFLLFHLGMYQATRSLPWNLPLVEEIYASAFVANVAFAAFLILLLSTIHRKCKGSAGLGLSLTLIGIALTIAFWFST